MPPAQNLAGLKFGLVTAIERLDKNHTGAWLWSCVCDCGNRVIRTSAELRRKQSCGCLSRTAPIEALGREAHGMTGTPEHNTWLSIKARCGHFQSNGRADYAGRSIEMCDRWRSSFVAFYADMGPRPSHRHSIDRIDNDGNYEPANCRWATPKAQSNNRRNSLIFSLNGISKPLSVWCSELGVNRHSVWSRLKRGIPFKDAINVLPIRAKTLTIDEIERSIDEWGRIIGVTRTSAYRLKRNGTLESRARNALKSRRS